MKRKLIVIFAFLGGLLLGQWLGRSKPVQAQSQLRVYRVYPYAESSSGPQHGAPVPTSEAVAMYCMPSGGISGFSQNEPVCFILGR
jgi:hypothetical protein